MSDDVFILHARIGGESDVALLAPSVGIFVPSVTRGALVGGGQSIGTIDVLGVRRELFVPDGVAGRVTERCGGSLARVPVEFGDVLATLSTASVDAAVAAGASRPG